MEQKALGVTSRELGRHAAALLDEVERSGRHVVISRYGRVVAFIGPMPDDYEPTGFERVHVAPRYEATAAFGRQEPVVNVTDEEIAALDDVQREFLLAVAAVAPDRWGPLTRDELFRSTSWGLSKPNPGRGRGSRRADSTPRRSSGMLSADRNHFAGHV